MAVTLTHPTRSLAQTAFAGLPARLLRAWHLLSLDAPTVAVLWTASLAHEHRLALPTAELASMFVTVWLLYVADRLLDAQPAHSPSAADLMPRHLFHRRHRRVFLAASIAATALLLPLTLHVPARDLHLDLLLAAALAAWFVLVHLLTPARKLPKEVVTGVFFAAATTIPTFTRRPGASLLPEAVLLAALCTLNGFFITTWETSRAPFPRQPHRGANSITLAVIAAATSFAVLTRSPATLAVALAAAALFLLDRSRSSLEPTTLRAAADFALLTPILLWPLLP